MVSNNEHTHGDRLTRIETKLDIVVEHLTKKDDDHEKRLRTMERRQWQWAGGVGAFAFVAAKIGLPWPAIG